MMGTKPRKPVSVLLTLIMLFSLLTSVPLNAMAAEGEISGYDGDIMSEGAFPAFDEWMTSTFEEETDTTAPVMSAGVTEASAAIGLSSSLTPQYGRGGRTNFLAPIDDLLAPGSIPIGSRAELEKIGNESGYPLYSNYHLTADIELASKEWVPIGGTNDNNGFTGTFDGQGYVISNLTINGEGYETSGLFSYVNGATIKNVGLEGTNIAISSASSSINVGGVCGSSYSSSYSSSYISNCYNTGDVSASTSSTSTSARAGGICGYSSPYSPISISNCYNTGDVSTSTSTSPTSSTSSEAGGICGSILISFSINNCYNTGDVSASSRSATAGGIYGYSWSTITSNCYNTGAVSASSSFNNANAGGICGYSSSTTISNCYNTGAVSASANAGGICGYNSPYSSISNCYWNIDSKQTVDGVELGDDNKKGVGSGTDTTTPLISAQMMVQSSFAGFDFDTIWGFKRAEYDYPVLRAFGDVDTYSAAILAASVEYAIGQLEVLSKPLKIPVSIIDNPGLASFQMTISYDPNILTAVAVENGTVWSGDITTNLNERGKAVIGGASASMRTGDGTIAVIEFEVNSAVPDGVYPITLEVNVLSALDPQYNQVEIPVFELNGAVTISSVMRGDIHENGVINAMDSVEVLLYLAELKEITERQMIAAKVIEPLNEEINILDANDILLVAVGLKNPWTPFTAPAASMPITAAYTFSAEEVALLVGTAAGDQGDTVLIPISISNNNGFSAFNFKIEYDKARLTPVSVVNGDVWPGGLTINMGAGDGKYILVNGISAENCARDGSIIELSFKINEDAGAGTAYVDLNILPSGLGYIDETSNVSPLSFSISNGSVSVNADSNTSVTYTVTQVGGTSGIADSTGIEITFSAAVNGLTDADITITDGTGSIIMGTLSGDGMTWMIALTEVDAEGNITIDIADFGTYAVTTTTQTVAVYKAFGNIKPGDINGDGNVNAADLSILLANFGKSGVAITNLAADLNGDSNVNAADLSILLANFGK